MAQPQLLVGPQPDLASSPNRLLDQTLEFGDEMVGVDQFGIEYLPPRKGEKLRRQLHPSLGRATRRGGTWSKKIRTYRRS